jgi:uncharacterized protein YqhQ
MVKLNSTRRFKMRSVLAKRGSVAELPGFFQIMMLVVIFAGLTFIVLEKFLASTTDGSLAETAVNDTMNSLYDYGIGFLGIIILVTMVYLIIRIVSGGGKRK